MAASKPARSIPVCPPETIRWGRKGERSGESFTAPAWLQEVRLRFRIAWARPFHDDKPAAEAGGGRSKSGENGAQKNAVAGATVKAARLLTPALLLQVFGKRSTSTSMPIRFQSDGGGVRNRIGSFRVGCSIVSSKEWRPMPQGVREGASYFRSPHTG